MVYDSIQTTHIEPSTKGDHHNIQISYITESINGKNHHKYIHCITGTVNIKNHHHIYAISQGPSTAKNPSSYIRKSKLNIYKPVEENCAIITSTLLYIDCVGSAIRTTSHSDVLLHLKKLY